MKKIFVTLLAAASVITSVTAQVQRKTEGRKDGQERMQGEGRGHDRFGKMKHQRMEAMSQLNLSEDQKNRLKAVNEDFKTKMKDLHKNDGITVKEARERREALAQEHKTQVQSILTSEQKAKLEELKAQGKEKMKQKEGKFGKGPDFDKLKTELNLTEDQAAKLKIRQEQAQASMKAIRDDQTLSQEQKKEKMMQIRKDNKEALEGVLTAEQQAKMKELHKNHKGGKGKNKQAEI